MKVGLIDDMDAFEAARRDWENVYAQDPTSTIFTSWAWFRGWLQSNPTAWAQRFGESSGRCCRFTRVIS
jgi:hypothetical protein